MNLKKIVSAILAVTVASSGGVAFADDRGDRNDRGRNEQIQRGDDHQQHGNRGRGNGKEERHEERGAGPNHNFYAGQRLPDEYHHRHYVVDDWRGHNLSAPPRGYHWVQTGGDYVLVAIATGVILKLLLSN